MTRILLVEPDKVLAQTYARFLSGSHEAICVRTAQDAIISVDKKMPDCIVLEVKLAEHNGVEFLYELRSHPDWAGVPVLIQSYVPRETMGLTQALQQKLGVVGYLYKPQTSLSQLGHSIDAVVGVRT